MYLTATAPSIEDVNITVLYNSRLYDIEEKDWLKEAKKKIIPDVARVTAITKGISIEEYYKGQAEDLKETAIKNLKAEYGIQDDSNDGGSTTKDIIDEHKEKMKSLKSLNIYDLLNKPDIKEDEDDAEV